MRFPGQRDAALLHPVRGADQFGSERPAGAAAEEISTAETSAAEPGTAERR